MHDGKFNLITTEQKLLFDIRQLLIEQNVLLKSFSTNNVKDNAPNVSIDEFKHDEGKSILPFEIESVKCQICGMIHENTGQRLACAKKNKNKGGK